jgi:hypothetical protein
MLSLSLPENIPAYNNISLFLDLASAKLPQGDNSVRPIRCSKILLNAA